MTGTSAGEVSPLGDLTLGHVMAAAGLSSTDVLVVRHTFTVGGLQGPADLDDQTLLEYTKRQSPANKVGMTPPKIWLIFVADGGLRSRFLLAYDNLGDPVVNPDDGWVHFDLRRSSLLSSLSGRLLIEWSRDAVNWAKSGSSAAAFPVLEIADPDAVPFPGFDNVMLTFHQLREVVVDSRFESWRTALGAVQGVYLIADRTSGRLYVGKADGGDRILGRWSQYARSGHGGNEALQDLLDVDPNHAEQFQFSILRVFEPSAPRAQVDKAESYFKRALLTRSFGLNRN